MKLNSVLSILSCLCLLLPGCGKEQGYKLAPKSPTGSKNVAQKETYSFQISDTDGDSTFSVQIDDEPLDNTTQGGTLDKSLPLERGEHTLTLTRLLGPTKKGSFMVVLSSQKRYYFQLYTSGINIEFLKGAEAGLDNLSDELGYRIAKGRLFLSHSVTLKITIE